MSEAPSATSAAAIARWPGQAARVVPIAALVGSAGAFFLWSLDAVTRLRWDHPWLPWFLPAAGIAIVAAYRFVGQGCEHGTNLLLEAVRDPSKDVPPRLAPLILLATLVTHLFGGSAGREGTAVQMGGGITAWLSDRLRTAREDRSVLMQAGMAAGFGAVFGTPIAAAVFALEVDTMGRIRWAGSLPCLAAAFLADFVCRLWGAPHVHYAIGLAADRSIALSPAWLFQGLLVGLVAGPVARGFVETTHVFSAAFRRLRSPWIASAIGGLMVVALSGALGTTAYQGIGVTHPDPAAPSLAAMFHAGGVTDWGWIWKLLFTAITLASGFKGGEVTPLFFIGAALGHATSRLCGLPVELGAGLGFVAVFAGASNTPIACVLMGCELFGWKWLPCLALACGTAYLASGHAGIYSSQHVARPKWPWARSRAGRTLGELR